MAEPTDRASWWGWSRPWEDFYRRLLPAYVLFLFAGTHLPSPSFHGGPSDKRIHFIVFGVLALAFWKFCESFMRPLSGRFVWIALPVLATYAAFDEWTQQFFGRETELADWIANLAGIVTVLAILEGIRRWQGVHSRGEAKNFPEHK